MTENKLSSYEQFKDPFVDDRGVLHYYTYIYNEEMSKTGLTLNHYLEESVLCFNEYCTKNKLKTNEASIFSQYIFQYDMTEIEIKAGLISSEGT